MRSQLMEDGVYPNASGVLDAASQDLSQFVADFDPSQPRNEIGEWTSGGAVSKHHPKVARYVAIFHEHERHRRRERSRAKRRAREEREKAEAERKGAEKAEPEEHPTPVEHAPTPGKEEGAVKPLRSVGPTPGLATAGNRASIPDGPFGSIVRAEGVTIKVTGKTLTAEGSSYEQGIRDTFGSGSTSHVFELGIGHVDDIISNEKQVVEAKYTADFERSIYNPEYYPGFAHTEVEDTISEITKRASHFEQGVVIFTNSEQFAATYDRLLAARHVVKYRFVIAPFTR